jgi:hypothetical protein
MRGKLRKLVVTTLAVGPAMLAAAAPAGGTRISFVSCPIVRDTRSVPCWIADYQGDRYYLTIQSDVSAVVQPPMLGHQVLVEGVVSADPAVCGGIVLSPVRLSVMPERDANCNTMLPVDERYTIDFNPRPPGPSGGRLAFDPPPAAAAGAGAAPRQPAPTPQGPQSIDLHFDFDRGVSFRHPGDLMGVVQRARQVGAKRMRITGVRGAHRLTDGTVLREAETIGQRRAQEVAGLLAGAGLDLPATIEWADATAEADGIDDWQSRRVTVVLTP